MNKFVYARPAAAISLLLLLVVTGCGRGGSGKPAKNEDSCSGGEIFVAVDQSLQPVMEREVYTFGKIYKYTKVNAGYTTEAEAVNLLMTDSARIIVIPRQLTAEEHKFFTDKQLNPRTTHIAWDGVAVLLNNQNPDTNFNFSVMQAILSGKITRWNKIPGAKNRTDAPISIVVDNNNSSIVKYLQDSLLHSPQLPANYAAVNADPGKVIDFVAANKNAIGLVGLAWVSDENDSTTNSFLGKVRVAGVTNREDGAEFYKPYLAYLYKNYYPLRRKVYVINPEGRAGLGTCLASYIAGPDGQRILNMSDILPAISPIRLVEMRKEPLQ
jgi:phosphate transport system substrate-binding protein